MVRSCGSATWCCRIWLVFVCCLTLCSFASAGPPDYVFNSPYLPDFDQKRLIVIPCNLDGGGTYVGGLPFGGDMYCVPTAAMNWMAFLAEFGFPALMPGGPLYWQGNAAHCDATNVLDQLGDQMNTDGETGTDYQGSKGGLQTWIDQRVGPGQFVVERARAQFTYAPTLTEIATAGHLGYWLNMNVGWYDEVPVVGGSQWLRRGGHDVTLVAVLSNTFGELDQDDASVRFRNPSSSDSLTEQSPFKNSTRDVTWVVAGFSNGSNNPAFGVRRMACLGWQTGSGNMGFLHGYLGITPCSAVLDCGPQLKLNSPMENLPGVPPNTILTFPDSIGGIGFGPTLASLLVTFIEPATGQPGPDVHCVDPVTGTTTLVHSATGPVVHFEVGQNTDTYVLSGGSLLRFESGGSTTLPVASITPSIVADTFCMAGIYGGEHDLIFAVGTDITGGDVFATYDCDLSVETVVPTPLPSGALAGTRYLAIDPVEGTLWARSSGSANVYELSYDPNGTGGPTLSLLNVFTDPALIGATGLTVDRARRFFVANGGNVSVYSPNLTGGWQLDATAPFFGEEVGTRILIRNGRDLSDRGEFLNASDINLLPEDDPPSVETELCPPGSSLDDCNGNRIADGCDIAAGTSRDDNMNGIPDECEVSFRRGYCDGDGQFSMTDPLFLLLYLFSGGTTPTCADACDNNDDGNLDLGDAVYGLFALFGGGAPPQPPAAACGVDPTLDTLECDVSAPCP